jgi:hypothetical protein
MRRMHASALWLCSVASLEERRFRQPARLDARSPEALVQAGFSNLIRRLRAAPGRSRRFHHLRRLILHWMMAFGGDSRTTSFPGTAAFLGNNGWSIA